SINGSLNLSAADVQGGRISLLSNSSNSFIVNGAGPNSIAGTINVNGSSFGSVSIANFGSGGISVATPSDITVTGGTGGGSSVTVTTNPAPGFLPVSILAGT